MNDSRRKSDVLARRRASDHKEYSMLRIAGTILLATVSTLAFADTYVQGHFRKNGTYVQPHYRSSPNCTTLDNYSTQGNVNPYTGKVGTKAPDTYNGPYVPPAYQPAQRRLTAPRRATAARQVMATPTRVKRRLPRRSYPMPIASKA
jgi:hypothetical protein